VCPFLLCEDIFAEKIRENMWKRIVSIILAISVLFSAQAQKRAFAINVVDYFNFLTINGEVSLAFSRHWSGHFRCRYSPFILKEGTLQQMQNKRLEFSAGIRYWIWNINSGWFTHLYPSYSKYNKGGIFNEKTYEGESYGALLGGGYAFMLSKRVNLELGVELRAGYKNYVIYEHPKGGRFKGKWKELFIEPGNVLIQFAFIF
jgi:hypothetical protein